MNELTKAGSGNNQEECSGRKEAKGRGAGGLSAPRGGKEEVEQEDTVSGGSGRATSKAGLGLPWKEYQPAPCLPPSWAQLESEDCSQTPLPSSLERLLS